MELTAPKGVSRLHLDTSLHIHATDGKGKLIMDDDTGKPVHIAQDIFTGLWYRKVASKNPKAHTALIDAGGVHVPHDNELFRGVWLPLEVEDEPASKPEKGGKKAN